MSDIRVCKRCGIEFDATAFLLGAPCEDCQEWEETPDTGWLKVNYAWQQLRAAHGQRRDALVAKYAAEGYSNKDIARIIGLTNAEVSRTRTRLGLGFPEKVKLLEYSVQEYDRQTMERKRRKTND